LRLRLYALTSPRTLSRRFMMQKVRNQAFPCGHSPLPACRHTISGSLDSPHRGSFHLSLAVLVHYRSTGSIQACEMVLAHSGSIAMLHFLRFARSPLCIQGGVRRHFPPWVSPFGHRRIKAWLAAPRRFSQLPTSFFASSRLGIHRVPLVAWSSFCSSLPFHFP